MASLSRNHFPLYFCSQGEQATCAYIVLHGRLRSVVKKSDGKKEMLEELGRGEAVGVVRVCMCTSFMAERLNVLMCGV